MGIVWTLRAIFGAVVCGDFLLAGVIWLALELRERRENAGIRQGQDLPRLPPDEKPDAPERVKEAREDAEAWRRMMSYSAADAYGMGDSG